MIIDPHRFVVAGGGGSTPVIESGFDAVSDSAHQTYMTMTLPTSTASGDLLLLGGGESNTTVWDTPSGFTVLNTSQLEACGLNYYYRVADGTETSTIQLGRAGGSKKYGWYIRITGNNSTPIHINNSVSTSSSGTSHAIPGITTTVDNCLALYFLAFDGGDGDPFSVSGTGWTEEDELESGTAGSNAGGCWGSKDQASSGATGTATVTSDQSDGAQYFQVTIAPA